MKGLACLTFALFLAPAAAQVLIVNESTAVAELTRNEARLYVTMRLKQWPDGTQVRLFVLPDDHDLHQRFVNVVLGLYPYQLRRVWDRQIFTGTGQAPTRVSSEDEMIQRVASTPGAIGYIESSEPSLGVRAVQIH
ncbi:hypothetical protein [Thiorhodococcus minor]|uniref:PBP domain-containing protein n=1 Tax=Thiorhodococcus minor TaxID=57489 RepID=A0A6M0JY66_9GAMM|nr:hypothetical protein [Thiorhodococcus minor]NEV61961.1 hypothetical protein [Thiorhodococcus minor]